LKEQGNNLKKIQYLVSYARSVLSLKSVNKLARNVDDIYRLFAAPASDLLNEWFESNVLKATLATDSVIGAMLSPYSEGSAYVLLHHCIGGVEGQKGKYFIYFPFNNRIFKIKNNFLRSMGMW
jgi:phytoene dehydrogenase-like protein